MSEGKYYNSSTSSYSNTNQLSDIVNNMQDLKLLDGGEVDGGIIQSSCQRTALMTDTNIHENITTDTKTDTVLPQAEYSYGSGDAGEVDIDLTVFEAVDRVSCTLLSLMVTMKWLICYYRKNRQRKS